MQKILLMSQIRSFPDNLDAGLASYLEEGQVETYESFPSFDLLAFDWYDILDPEAPPAQIILYLNSEDLFLLCENEAAMAAARAVFEPDPDNWTAAYRFFRSLLMGDMKQLDALENQVAELDDDVTDGTEEGLRERLIDMRNAVLRLKKYYEGLEFLMACVCENEQSRIPPETARSFVILHSRTVRLVSRINSIREYLASVRDSYQGQVSIEQNELMKVFTLVTSIFLPLTLVAGWYGMNLRMPEFGWKHGYLYVIGLCAAITAVWLLYFKKKKWFK